jgi:outer membrane protein assembly factor BamE
MFSAFRALAAAPLVLAACASKDVPVPQVIQPYRMVIQQGNFISQEMVAQLKPGMTKEQVRFVLGTPLVTDIFHSDRWDYVYYRELAAGAREQRNLSVIFEGGKLTRVIGDLLPSEAPPAPAKPAAAVAKPAAEKPKPEATGASPSAEKPKPAAETTATEARQQPAAQPAGQNWGTAGEARTAPEPPRPSATTVKAEEAKPEPAPEQKSERGFFGRMLEKIGF